MRGTNHLGEKGVGVHHIQSSALVMSFSFVSAVDSCDVCFQFCLHIYRVGTVGSVYAYTCLRRMVFGVHTTRDRVPLPQHTKHSVGIPDRSVCPLSCFVIEFHQIALHVVGAEKVI